MNFFEQISTREFIYKKEYLYPVRSTGHAKIHSIIQKESSIELFHESLLKKQEEEKIPSYLLIL
jgi:hypothetical protein